MYQKFGIVQTDKHGQALYQPPDKPAITATTGTGRNEKVCNVVYRSVAVLPPSSVACISRSYTQVLMCNFTGGR